MNKDFVPYEEALALKGLGFDEECYGHHTEGVPLHIGLFLEQKKDLTSAPLYQQAFRWFREEYGLLGIVNIAKNGNYYYDINQINPYKEIYQGVDFYEPEEAELACLKNLIEIVKDK